MRDRRFEHVRPRPPSDGHLHRRPIRAAAPPTESLRRYRPIRTGRDVPLPVGIVLTIVVVCLAFGALLIGTGAATKITGDLTAALANAVNNAASRAPSTQAPVPGQELATPVLDEPPNGGFTKERTVDIKGTIPAEVIGKTGYAVQLYSIAADKSRVRIGQVEVGGTVEFGIANVGLVNGPNTFVARLVGPNLSGEESTPIVYTLDTTPPTITITSPKGTKTTTASTVQVTGKTEPHAALVVNNAAAGNSWSGEADDQGAFQATVGLVPGANPITVTAADKAGNAAAASVTVKRDQGKLAAHLTVTPNQFPSATPTQLTVTVRALSAEGLPLVGAQVTFTAQISGLGPIVYGNLKTDATGTAVWKPTITGATPGNGIISVQVSAAGGISLSDHADVITT